MTVVPEPQIGDVLDGRYRLDALSGSGGMAHVFRAHDFALGRVVAVKIVHAHGAAQSGQERIRAEVRLLASVNGHSLVTLLDARVADHGPSYLVMEYVEGPTLSNRLSEGRLSVGELDLLAADLADALHVVHAAGIVHRDVKPSNVLLTRLSPDRPYRAKLADFGIAHLLDSTRVTTPGLTVGTAAYIAPELLDGADPRPPADIYALGLVLLEAATGRRAFGTTDARAEVLARLTRDPHIPASLGADRRALLTRMTSRDPQERPDAAELVARLAALPPADSTAASEDTVPVAVVAPGAEPTDAPAASTAATRPYALAAGTAGDAVGRRPRSRTRRRAILAGSVSAVAVAAVAWTLAAGAAAPAPEPDVTIAVDSTPEPTTSPPPAETVTESDDSNASNEETVSRTVSSDGATVRESDSAPARARQRAGQRQGSGLPGSGPATKPAKATKKTPGAGKGAEPQKGKPAPATPKDDASTGPGKGGPGKGGPDTP